MTFMPALRAAAMTLAVGATTFWIREMSIPARSKTPPFRPKIVLHVDDEQRGSFGVDGDRPRLSVEEHLNPPSSSWILRPAVYHVEFVLALAGGRMPKAK